ncbi:MAG: DUF4382 domain-containing protein [Halobellus sp.]|uniref:DUF4382 domain-containing protein n=1 Tax=Halobellus sp. TaxID=1979212 RepID=UPI0035D4154C
MNRNAIATVLVAALVLLAGCSGGLTGSPDGTTATDSAAQPTGSTTTAGTVNFYVSDQQNAISDFEHLNVTITRVGLKPAAGDAGGAADDSAENDTQRATDSTETTTDADEATFEDEAGSESEEWVEYEVDNRTVDLTQLQGANATRLASFDVPNGTYEKVFVYVSEVNGTLKDGSDQRVKLPSGNLQLNSAFTVGNSGEVDFVFDITAVKAGQSGKYVLKPVISESGTNVEIDPVEKADDGDDADDRGDERTERVLNASLVGNVTRGENATLSVTRNGSSVQNASVSVGGAQIGSTAAAGTITVPVSENAEELEVVVTKGDTEAEVTVELGDEVTASETQTQKNSGSGNSNAVSYSARLKR